MSCLSPGTHCLPRPPPVREYWIHKQRPSVPSCPLWDLGRGLFDQNVIACHKKRSNHSTMSSRGDWDEAMCEEYSICGCHRYTRRQVHRLDGRIMKNKMVWLNVWNASLGPSVERRPAVTRCVRLSEGLLRIMIFCYIIIVNFVVFHLFQFSSKVFTVF